MKRGWRINNKSGLLILGIAAFLVICAISLPRYSYANTYYYTETEQGTYYYTNIKPNSKQYKSMDTPWGVLKTAPKANKQGKLNKNGSFKYSPNYDRHIESTARWYGVDPLLIKAIIKVESNFNPHAVSKKGAMGMMQLMPGTAKKNGVKDAFDAQENIEGGVRYFSKLMLMFNHRLTLALAGYNAGENAVIKYGYKIPPYPETIDYVKKVYIHYDNLRNKKVKRNIHAMVAERFDKKSIQYTMNSAPKNVSSSPQKSSKSSFIYVETLESSRVVKNSPRPQKPKVISKPTVRAINAKAASPVYADANLENSTNSPALAKGRYTIQIASFPEQGAAMQMESNLKAKTYPAYVQKTDIPGKGTWYRVRVGKFETKSEAKRFGDDLVEKETSVKSVFVASN